MKGNICNLVRFLSAAHKILTHHGSIPSPQAHAMAVLVSNFASAVEKSAAPPAVSRLCILFAVEGVIQHSGEQQWCRGCCWFGFSIVSLA